MLLSGSITRLSREICRLGVRSASVRSLKSFGQEVRSAMFTNGHMINLRARASVALF